MSLGGKRQTQGVQSRSFSNRILDSLHPATYVYSPEPSTPIESLPSLKGSLTTSSVTTLVSVLTSTFLDPLWGLLHDFVSPLSPRSYDPGTDLLGPPYFLKDVDFDKRFQSLVLM